MTSRQAAYTAIDGERAYQAKRWNEPYTRSIDEFALYIIDYANEAGHQATRGDEVQALNTIRKVAGLCVAAMEQHGAPRREGF